MTESFPECKEKESWCAACGNSPVNHLSTYCMQTLDVWTENRRFEKKGVRSRFDVFIEYLGTRLEKALMRSMRYFPLSRFTNDPKNAASYRSQVIWEEANRRGIPMEQLSVGGVATEVYRARPQESWTYFQSLPIPQHLENKRLSWIDDKYLLKKTLREAGIPVPRFASATGLQHALAAFRDMGGPVVIKPRAGSRARHTTVNIRTEKDLIEAFSLAKQLCRYVAIEEYLEGSVCRATLVSNRLVGFLKGDAPVIVGDGHSTIRELVALANTKRHERVQEIVLSDEHVGFLRRSGYELDSIPRKGERVLLTHRTGRLFGGTTREMVGAVHPKLRDILVRAAEATGAPVIGFDLVIHNPESDPERERWGIIEANSLPFIDLHYLPLEGEPSNVAGAVWDLWNEHVS